MVHSQEGVPGDIEVSNTRDVRTSSVCNDNGWGHSPAMECQRCELVHDSVRDVLERISPPRVGAFDQFASQLLVTAGDARLVVGRWSQGRKNVPSVTLH